MTTTAPVSPARGTIEEVCLLEGRVLASIASAGVHGVDEGQLFLSLGATAGERPSRAAFAAALLSLEREGHLFHVIGLERRWFISARRWSDLLILRVVEPTLGPFSATDERDLAKGCNFIDQATALLTGEG